MHKKINVAGVIGVCAALMVGISFSYRSVQIAVDHSGNEARSERLVTAVTKGQMHVDKTFAGPDNLIGAVVENRTTQQRDIAWLSPDAKVALVGQLLDGTGRDYLRDAEIQQGLILSPTAVLMQAIEPERHSFVQGKAGPTLTVFFDPNCAYCHIYYGQLAPIIGIGLVRVRYVVVGLVQKDSALRAASILAAFNPAQAMVDNEQHFDASHEEGGYRLAPKPDPALMAAVASNNALFVNAGFNGTPITLYCNKHGAIQMQAGVPNDLKAFVAKAGDCP